MIKFSLKLCSLFGLCINIRYMVCDYFLIVSNYRSQIVIKTRKLDRTQLSLHHMKVSFSYFLEFQAIITANISTTAIKNVVDRKRKASRFATCTFINGKVIYPAEGSVSTLQFSILELLESPQSMRKGLIRVRSDLIWL